MRFGKVFPLQQRIRQLLLHRFALEDSLRSAVESARLAVHYQPKLDMYTGSIERVEALARWQAAKSG